jgi:hypothetical protein
MTTNIDLKQIEEKTRASYFEDGLWDIGVGLTVLAISLLVSLWFSAGEAASWWWFLLPPAIAAMPAIARRYITYPRTGQVKLHWLPSGNRRRKILYVTCVVIEILLISVGLASYDLIGIPDVAGGVIMGTGWLLFFGTFGYFWGYRLAYAYGLLMGISAALARSVDSPAGEIMVCACGALMVVIGLARTIRFFHKYPKPSMEDAETNARG